MLHARSQSACRPQLRYLYCALWHCLRRCTACLMQCKHPCVHGDDASQCCLYKRHCNRGAVAGKRDGAGCVECHCSTCTAQRTMEPGCVAPAGIVAVSVAPCPANVTYRADGASAEAPRDTPPSALVQHHIGCEAQARLLQAQQTGNTQHRCSCSPGSQPGSQCARGEGR